MLCNYDDRSCDHTHCDGGDMFFICHVTSREHILRGLCEYISGNSSRRVTNFPCLMAIGLM